MEFFRPTISTAKAVVVHLGGAKYIAECFKSLVAIERKDKKNKIPDSLLCLGNLLKVV